MEYNLAEHTRMGGKKKKNRTFLKNLQRLQSNGNFRNQSRIEISVIVTQHAGFLRGSELISCQNFTFFPFIFYKLGRPPTSTTTTTSVSSSPLFPALPLRTVACWESAWLALDTKGGLFHEMFPFLMSDGVHSFNIPHWYLSGSWLCFKATAWL